MTKIAYIGPYKDGTGYSNACLENIMALDYIGVSVSPRSVKMTQSNGSLDERLKRIAILEKNDLNGIDVVFQHNLPSEFSFKSDVKNIGVFSYETDNFVNSGWTNNVKMMDEIVVAASFEKKAILSSIGSSIENKVHVIPFPTNVEKYTKKYDHVDFGVPNNCLKFYTVAEFNKRKNLETLLMSYFSAFDSSDNVLLIIKTNGGERAEAGLKQLIEQVRVQTKRFVDHSRFPKVLITASYLTEEQLLKFHANCHVFISSSHGESHCLPMIDAMGFGKPVIAPRHSVFLDHIEFPWQGRFVDTNQTFAFGAIDSLPRLYTSEELWGWVNPVSLAREMIWMYQHSDFVNSSSEVNMRKEYVTDKFNYATIGAKLKAIL